MLASDPRVAGKACSVMGDFNQTLNPNDHSISDGFIVDRATRVFRESLLDAGLLDLTFRSSTFTWWNKMREDPIEKKTRQNSDQ